MSNTGLLYFCICETVKVFRNPSAAERSESDSQSRCNILVHSVSRMIPQQGSAEQRLHFYTPMAVEYWFIVLNCSFATPGFWIAYGEVCQHPMQ